MPEQSKTFAFGTLEATSDTWILNAGSHIFLLELGQFDLSLEHKTVSIIGKMGIPPGAPGILKLMVEKLVPHNDIAIRAFNIFQSTLGTSQDDNCFRAEKQALKIMTPNLQ